MPLRPHKPSPLNKPLNVILIFRPYVPCSVGILLTSFRKPLAHTAQYSRLPTATMLKKAFKSPNPALNISRCNKDVACDIVYSDVPAIFDGSTAAVIFVGTSTKVANVHGIKKDNQFANTLEDNIIQQGHPNRLLSDQGQSIISHKVEDILRTFCIASWQSGPHQHHQNPPNDATRP
jgi:hypothetical protein